MDADIEVLRDFGVTQHGDAARYGLNLRSRHLQDKLRAVPIVVRQLTNNESLEFIASATARLAHSRIFRLRF